MPPPPPTKKLGDSASTSTSSNAPKNDRNEYIPSFISKKPFYIPDTLSTDSDYLEHQRLSSSVARDADSLANAKWYSRGVTASNAKPAAKYRKGACTNCGAMGHSSKDCVSRTRKSGARWTGKDMAADEVVQDVKLGWDAKRDRWNGYDAAEYASVVEEYAARDVEEGTKYEEETDMGRKQPTSTRQLRLREDTAKYLLNLDLDSARYDPKTRAMLDPLPGEGEGDAEDGFERAADDKGEFERAQKYAWESQERGDKDAVHLQANPTAGAIQRKKVEKEKDEMREAKQKALEEKYGIQSTSTTHDIKRPMVIVENERFVEYDEKGRVKGQEEKKEKSMYVEDVYINNHTSVWGSWWKDFKWGYACCHSILKNSYCVGEEGRHAVEESTAISRGQLLVDEGNTLSNNVINGDVKKKRLRQDNDNDNDHDDEGQQTSRRQKLDNDDK